MLWNLNSKHIFILLGFCFQCYTNKNAQTHNRKRIYKTKVYKTRDGILTLFFSNVSIQYLHVMGNSSDNYYTGNVHLIWVTAELPKCNSLKLAVIKVTWPRCRNIQTSSFLFWCLIVANFNPTAHWLTLNGFVPPPLVPDTRHKNVTSVLPKFCAPHTSTLEEWSITEQSYMDTCRHLFWKKAHLLFDLSSAEQHETKTG